MITEPVKKNNRFGINQPTSHGIAIDKYNCDELCYNSVDVIFDSKQKEGIQYYFRRGQYFYFKDKSGDTVILKFSEELVSFLKDKLVKGLKYSITARS